MKKTQPKTIPPALYQAMLDERARSIARMHDIQGCSYEQIALFFTISKGTAFNEHRRIEKRSDKV